MPDVWLPGVYRDPGLNADYNSGQSSMERAVAHYTVGADSRGVAKRGFFHFLVHQEASREGGCTQYAEVDAVTWHAAGAGNPYGPGVEWERRVIGGVGPDGLSEAEPLTQNQIDWGSRLIDFFAEWGIPSQLYDGPRYQGGGWNGWINHQAIDSARSDGLTRAEWDAMRGGVVAPPTENIINREAIDKMYGVYLPYINWVDVYYNGVQVESYENVGPHNAFGIGPALSSLMEKGVHVTTINDKNAYERPNGIRDQLLAESRAALKYLKG